MSAGVLNQISIAKESVWGTPVTPTKSIPVQFSGGINTDIDLKMLSAVKAQFAANYDSFTGKRKHTGDYMMDFFPDYPSYFLLSALGLDTPAVHAGETIVYDHVMTESLGSSRPSLTIEQMVGENIRRYAGVLTDGFKVTVKDGEVVTLSPTLQAKSEAYQATPITPAYSTVRPFNFADMSIKVGGVALTEFSSFELDYKSGLEMVYAIGQNDPSFNVVKKSTVTGKMDLYLDTTTLAEYNNMLSKTYRSLELIGTGDAIGSAAHNALDIFCPKVAYKTAVTKITDNYNLLEIDFEGIFDTATSELIKVTTTNLLATLS